MSGRIEREGIVVASLSTLLFLPLYDELTSLTTMTVETTNPSELEKNELKVYKMYKLNHARLRIASITYPFSSAGHKFEGHKVIFQHS